MEEIFDNVIKFAEEKKHEYVTAEHLLYIITFNKKFIKVFESCEGDIKTLRHNLEEYLNSNIEVIEEGNPEVSYSLNELISKAAIQAQASEKDEIDLIHIVNEIMDLNESYASYYILTQGVNKTELITAFCEEEDYIEKEEAEVSKEESLEQKDTKWQKYVTCLNDFVDTLPPLIGREKEIERTIQILCRKYKNNPIHIGEAGVGKTAITSGLARLINEGKVPDKLKGAKIFSLDLGGMLAGTQYRGDFEKRLKSIMEGVKQFENPIIYIDEIHNIVGAGAINGGGFDASNMLKPYLTDGSIRFIGATTYEEFNKYFAKSKSLIRRFQKIDIKEPSIDEAIEIITGLKSFYEDFHNVKYAKGAIEHAVILSDKYLNERYLPDKAIDLIDEAGAYRVMHPTKKKVQTVDKKLIEEVLSKTCNIPKETVETDEVKKLSVLEKKIKEQVYGQDEAIESVVNAIKLSRAGLNDDNKPIASLLFVGPTGVGKTEIAKVLSKTLDIELIRFDMSEYVEKHTVAKLIGAPAGYVGYEEGGLLTAAIRKNPHAVLLLDEVEKAHPDIFNVLLQVMDYATLTDNQGKKTDFRNVILIMTSNAGASSVGKSLIGFGEREISRTAIDEAVKKTFTPEFRNRLSKKIVFNSLNSKMATMIVKKQFKILNEKLSDKNIKLNVTKACIKYIENKGTSQEYGAREISRIINSEIKPLLVDKILFGDLKKGGECVIDFDYNKIIIK
ncbi:MAG: ATP-dependent Clp protease ATP-binding subunit ClpA [Clostridiaceae bacterium]|nr:ATP-dependent Clp protease ATP-binding subunit ClpA [Clostridiaceae bacterium]